MAWHRHPSQITPPTPYYVNHSSFNIYIHTFIKHINIYVLFAKQIAFIGFRYYIKIVICNVDGMDGTPDVKKCEGERTKTQFENLKRNK